MGHPSFKNKVERFYNEVERFYNEMESYKSDSKPTKRKHPYVIYSEQSNGAKNLTRFLNIIIDKTSSAQLQLVAASALEMTFNGKFQSLSQLLNSVQQNSFSVSTTTL